MNTFSACLCSVRFIFEAGIYAVHKSLSRQSWPQAPEPLLSSFSLPSAGLIGLCYYGPLCSQILNTNLYNVSQNIAALSYTIFKTTKQNKRQETDSCLPRYRAKHTDMAEIRRGIGFQKLEVWFCGRA